MDCSQQVNDCVFLPHATQPVNTRNRANYSILETSWSMSQFYTMGKKRISIGISTCETHTCSPQQHESKGWNGIRYRLGLLQLSSKHAFWNTKTILCNSRVVWIEIMVLLKGIQTACYQIVPLKHTMCIAIQCACLLPKCPLKACNVSAGYQSVP